ncbi:MAG: tetratricopeptide repeat protein [Vicinamibacterales bacterium]
MARRLAAVVAAALFVFAASLPAAGQTTMLRGKVVTPDKAPVQGAQVVVEYQGGVKRRFESKTDRKGEFVQLLTESGPYTVTVTHQKLGTHTQTVQVRLGQASEFTVVLDPAAAAAGGGGDESARAALKAAFDAGVAASGAGNYDEAIAKFTEAAGILPNCFDCYYNIGYAWLQKKDEAQAEANWKKAIELKPDYPQALSALATLYNNQKRYDEASAMGDRAAQASAAGGGGGDAATIYNQGIILWNQGKIAEAKTKFEEAIAANPQYPESHYQLGLALLNEGRTSEAVAAFEKYLALAPDGSFAEQARKLIAELKQLQE